MEVTELIEIINLGEDSKHQFKVNVTNETSLAQDFVAFSNSGGGQLFIGVSDDNQVNGLSQEDIGRLNNLVSNASSQQVRPAINPVVENIQHPDGRVMVVTVPNGISKPYMDKGGVIWVKSGADKRKATSREEIQRMYQNSNLIHGDEIPANGLTITDIDNDCFESFFHEQFEERVDAQDISLQQIFENLNLAKNGELNIAGALLFCPKNALRLPAFVVKCVAYPGNDIHEEKYLDSPPDLSGTLLHVYQSAFSFIVRNLKNPQNEQSINSTGDLEIPKITIEEILVNALIHRDFFVSAPIRIFIFQNRIEILSPGHLPNNLTIENIKVGNSNIRNPILASYATKVLPYRGLGNGIRRALKAYPEIDFLNDFDGNLFTVIIKRKAI